MTHSFRAAVTALRLDPGQLSIRDRVVLRILNRARLVNAQQLGALVYHRRRHTQARLRRLWDLGYLERSGLAPPLGHSRLALCPSYSSESQRLGGTRAHCEPGALRARPGGRPSR